MLLTVAATRAEGPGATEKNDKNRCWLQTELLEDRVSGLASLLVGTFVDIFVSLRVYPGKAVLRFLNFVFIPLKNVPPIAEYCPRHMNG